MTGISSSNALSEGDELSVITGLSIGNGLSYAGFNNIPTTDALLLQDGFYLLLQDGGHLLVSVGPASLILLEGGAGDILLEDGTSYLTLES